MPSETPLRVLLITIRHWWIGVSRLPMALHRAGFTVAAWCPDETFIARSAGVTKHFRWDPSANWRAELSRVFNEWKPHVIIPADETMAVFLRKLARRPVIMAPGQRSLRDVLHRSLGDPVRAMALDGKIALQRLANSLGVRTPDDRAVDDLAGAMQAATSLGYPVVLKDDFAAGGTGVKICQDETALRTSWTELEALKIRRSLKTRIRERLRNPFTSPAKRRSVQKFIKGQPAFHAVVAWQGRRLGGITAIVEAANPPITGPSCVVRVMELPEVSRVCELLIAQTGLSGFAGFDFMIEEGTGQAFILECNPRPTPVSHLGGLVGANLCASFRDALLGRPIQEAPPITEQLLAFFPQELLRDPASPYLGKAHLDYPSDDAPLLQAFLERHPDLAQAMTSARAFLPTVDEKPRPPP